MSRVIFILLLCSINLRADTWYVSKAGDDGNSGTTTNDAFASIGKASTAVSAGDLVIIGAGTFYEHVTNTVNGSAGNYVTYTGTRDSNGDWLTLIEAGIPASTNWYVSPIATNVYWNTNLAWTVREMEIDGKRVAYCYTNGSLATHSDDIWGEGWTGFEFLATPSNQVSAALATSAWDGQVWDGVEACYISTNGVTFLRFRDSRDPNGENITVHPNHQTSVFVTTAYWPAINLGSGSYTVWSNLWIRGSFVQIQGNGADNNVIVSNRLDGGTQRIALFGGSYSNKIIGNNISTHWYGFDNCGAHEGNYNDTVELYGIRNYLYPYNKYIQGAGTSFDNAIWLNTVGTNNIIAWNTIYQSPGNGVDMITGSLTSPTFDTLIFSNRISGFCSVGVYIGPGVTYTHIFGNRFDDSNIHVRPGTLNEVGETNRFVYYYRNTIWNPDGTGEAYYGHYNNIPPVDYYPTVWIYHNSYQGGETFWQMSNYTDNAGGASNHFIVNNIASQARDVQVVGADGTFYSDPNMVGGYDYNLYYPASLKSAAWRGVNNITNLTPVWNSVTNMGFSLTNGTPAIDAALDVFTTPFTFNSKSFSALPDLSGTVKVGAEWDMGALEYSAPPIVITNRVQYTEDLWLK